MNLEAVAHHMEVKRLGKRRQTIFIGSMPKDCKLGVLLLENHLGTPVDHELPGWVNTDFKVIVRAAGAQEGKALGWRIWRALTIKTDTPMGEPGDEIDMRQCLPFNEPKLYRRSDVSGYWEFEVEFNCIYIRCDGELANT